MANTIKLKRGSGSDPSASDLAVGEVALRTDTAKLFTKNDAGNVAQIGGGLSNVVDDTSPQLGGDLQSNGSDIDFADTDKAIFGGDGDLEIFHDGSNSYVQAISNGTGDLYVLANTKNIYLQPKTNENGIKIVPDGAVELYYDGNNKKLETTGAGIDVTGSVTCDGFTSSGADVAFNSGTTNANILFDASDLALEFDDNVKATFGFDQDLKIYHNGSHSFVQDTGTGSLKLAGADVQIVNADNTAVMAQFISGGANQLRHDGNTKLETTSTGVNVTGDLVTSDDVIINGTTNDESVLRFYDGGAGSWMIRQTNSDNILSFRRNSTNYLQLQANGNVDVANGLDVTGNITVSGTVDGRDVATDGTKLDGIESNATADQTAAEIKTLLNSNQLEAAQIANNAITAGKLPNSEVTFAKIQDVPQNRIIGRISSGSGVLQELTAANIRSIINVADGATNVTNNNQLTNGAGYITSADGGNAATLGSIGPGQFMRDDQNQTATGLITLTTGLELGADAKCTAALSSLTADGGGTITVNFTSGIHHSVTLGANRTLSHSNTANAVGQSGSIFITQDGTGGRTLSFNSAYKFVGGTAPTLSTGANAVDRLDYVVKASNVIHAVVSLDVK